MLSLRFQGFMQNLAILLGGSSLAQVIRLCLVPIVARLFTPEHFGVAALFLSLATIFAIGSTLRYDQAILLPDNDSEADAVTAAALVVLLVFCLVSLLVVGAVSGLLPEYGWVKDFGGWLFTLPIAVFLLGMSGIATSISLRMKGFKAISASEIAMSLATPGTRIGFGLWSGSSVAGLIIGLLFGFLAKLGVLLVPLTNVFKRVISEMRWEHVRSAARKYADFPAYNAPTGMMQSFYRNMPVLLLGLLFSSHVVGFYALANRLVRVPLTLISESVRKVYLQKSSELRNKNQALMRSFARTTIGLGCVGFPFFVLLFFFGEQIFSFLLGESWTTSGRYAALLTPAFFVIFILPPSSAIFIVLRKQALWFGIQLGITVASLLVFIVCDMLKAGPEQTLVAFAGWNVVSGVGVMLWAYTLTGKADRRLQETDPLVSEQR